ncbi:MAG: hypothetical protein HGA35_05820 [Erysipelotrichaceae bacterium]|nr:hypothetical protein [Erysipelotrichaceae bacterium]
MVRKFILVILFFSLVGCTPQETNKLTDAQINVLIENQNKQIETLKLELEELRQSLDQGELIQPFTHEDRLLYMNSRIPFGISLINETNLPIKVYAYDTHLVIYYENNDMSEYLIGYSVVSKLMGKEFSEDPEYFNNSDIVKEIDDHFVVIKNISIATDLDEETINKVKIMLDSIKYY